MRNLHRVGVGIEPTAHSALEHTPGASCKIAKVLDLLLVEELT